MYAYIGSRTTRERNARGVGITVLAVDPATAGLKQVQLVGDLVNPSFLVLNARGDRLYAVHGDTTSISAYAIDSADGSLSFINRQETQGKNPVHLAIDPGGRYMVVSNHIGASLAVLPIAADGALEPVSQLVPLDGPIGPHRIEQQQAKPHANPFSPDGRYVVVPDKGLDRLFSFRFEHGRLAPVSPAFVASREGAGPRHFVFHPSRRHAYCVNELDSTVAAYRYDDAQGTLAPLQILSTLPDTYTGNSRAAAIELDAAGRYLYVSNRGHDSIAGFRIEADTGMLKWVGAYATRGRTPRFITLMPGGRFMFALNEDSDSIAAFHVDPATGALTDAGEFFQTGSPVCMVFGAF